VQHDIVGMCEFISSLYPVASVQSIIYMQHIGGSADVAAHLVWGGGTSIYEMYGVGTIHSTPLFLKNSPSFTVVAALVAALGA
jgi:hypothetical protein